MNDLSAEHYRALGGLDEILKFYSGRLLSIQRKSRSNQSQLHVPNAMTRDSAPMVVCVGESTKRQEWRVAFASKTRPLNGSRLVHVEELLFFLGMPGHRRGEGILPRLVYMAT
jgi:hypothetical protein